MTTLGPERAQGMGEGEGKRDVSDQLENEDQLLGAQRPDQPEQQVRVPPFDGSTITETLSFS